MSLKGWNAVPIGFSLRLEILRGQKLTKAEQGNVPCFYSDTSIATPELFSSSHQHPHTTAFTFRSAVSPLVASPRSLEPTSLLLIACLCFSPACSLQAPLGELLASQDSSAQAGKAERHESTDSVCCAREFRCVLNFRAFSGQGWALLGFGRPSIKEGIWLSHHLTSSAQTGEGSLWVGLAADPRTAELPPGTRFSNLDKKHCELDQNISKRTLGWA